MTDLIVYLKAPIPGSVKTRLQTRYSPAAAAQLYRAFIQDTFDTASRIDVDRRYAAIDGPMSETEGLVPSGWNLVAQEGADLGERMRHSLNSSLNSGATKAILIGTDIPSLPPAHLVSAYSRLNDNDVVLGPTSDGGFYLIGARIELPDIFATVTCSSEHAFEQTADGIRNHGHMLGLIPPWNDIDTPEDLDAVLNTDVDGLPHTRRAIRELTS